MKSLVEMWLEKQSVRMPKGYTISAGGIRQEGRLITQTPVLPDAMGEDQDGKLFLRFAWIERGFIRRRMVARSDAAQGRFGILPDMGVDLGVHNRRAYTSFLRNVGRNLSIIPLASQCGWSPDMDAFLWGFHRITDDGIESADSCSASDLCLSPDTPRPFVEGLQQAGSFEGWKQAITPALVHPRAALALLAACAPPLLRILGAPNTGIVFSGPASTGKSTLVAIAASVWGDPDNRISWKNEPEWIEAAASALRDLPVIFDGASQNVDLESRVESVLSGQSEGKASRGRVETPARWSTVLIGAGGTGLDDFQNESISSRMFDLWGHPFRAMRGRESALLIEDLSAGIQENHGHLGPVLVQKLLASHNLWPKWRNLYQERKRKDVAWGADLSSTAARAAQNVALIRIVGDLIKNLFPDIPFSLDAILKELKSCIETSSSGAPQAAKALKTVQEWLTSDLHRIQGAKPLRMGEVEEVPPGGWIGRTDHEGRIWVIQGLLNDRLVEEGYLPERCIREWWASGDLIPSRDGKPTERKRLGYQNPVLVGFASSEKRVNFG